MPANYNPIPADELHARYWMLSHVSGAHKLGLSLFIVFDSILVLVILWFIVGLYGFQLLSYPRMLRSMAQPLISLNATSQLVEQLHVTETGGVTASGDRSDLYGLVQNPNAGYIARFTYAFSGDSRTFKGYIYPGQQKYLLDIGAPVTSGSQIQLVLSDVHWTKVSKKTIEEIKARTRLTIKDFQFIPSDSEIPFSRLTFNIENPTGYSFSHVALPVVLRYGGSVVAIHYTIIDSLMAAEKRVGDIRWFVPVGPVDGYAVEPDIDIFDPGTFLTPQGEPAPPAPKD